MGYGTGRMLRRGLTYPLPANAYLLKARKRIYTLTPIRPRFPERPAGLGGLVDIYPDGACRGNPGPGGWAALLSFSGREKELAGAEALTTNNRMELTAVIRALEALKRPVRARVYTDSEYVRRGILEWIKAWKARGWLTADRKPVKNQDLWERLDALAAGHAIEWHWVPGPAGVPGNERVDRLANEAIDAMASR